MQQKYEREAPDEGYVPNHAATHPSFQTFLRTRFAKSASANGVQPNCQRSHCTSAYNARFQSGCPSMQKWPSAGKADVFRLGVVKGNNIFVTGVVFHSLGMNKPSPKWQECPTQIGPETGTGNCSRNRYPGKTARDRCSRRCFRCSCVS